MSIDWALLLKIAVPFGTLILGRVLDRVLTWRPKLISYLGHVSSFTVGQDAKTPVFTHAIVIRNTGRKAATTVRVGHHVLPDYKITPSIAHDTEDVPNGGKEIKIPSLVPGEQITISYLYFPPLTWNQVNAYVKSEEGMAKVLNVIPTPRPSKWLIWLVYFLMGVGMVALLYLAAYLFLG